MCINQDLRTTRVSGALRQMYLSQLSIVVRIRGNYGTVLNAFRAADLARALSIEKRGIITYTVNLQQGFIPMKP